MLEQKAFTDCRASNEILEQFKKDTDSVLMFLEERGYQPSQHNFIPLKDLHNFYKWYCQEEGYTPCGNKEFRKRLEGQGYKAEKKDYGIGVKAEIHQ